MPLVSRFFFQNNQIPQTILLVSQGFETILVSNKSSTKNSILLYEIALGNRVSHTRVPYLSVPHSNSKCNISEQIYWEDRIKYYIISIQTHEQ